MRLKIVVLRGILSWPGFGVVALIGGFLGVGPMAKLNSFRFIKGNIVGQFIIGASMITFLTYGSILSCVLLSDYFKGFFGETKN